MKSKLMLLLGIVLGAIGAQVMSTPSADGDEKAAKARVYELRTYTTLEGRLPALNKRFREHTMRLFEKHGMKNVVYLTPTDKPETLVYLITHESVEAAKKSWDAFRADPEWHAARDASEKDGKIVAKAESQYLNPTDYSPLK
jgi:hypothetical protein